MSGYSEDHLELTTLDWFKALGYSIAHGLDIAPDGRRLERASCADATLDDSTAKMFDSLVKPLYAMVAANVEENGTLAALRDSLLPKLLSGEVRVAGSNLAARGLSELEATHGRT